MSEDGGDHELAGWIKHVRGYCERIGIARSACEDMTDAQFFSAVYHRALDGRDYRCTLLSVDSMLAAAGVRDFVSTESAVMNLIAERDRLLSELSQIGLVIAREKIGGGK